MAAKHSTSWTACLSNNAIIKRKGHEASASRQETARMEILRRIAICGAVPSPILVTHTEILICRQHQSYRRHGGRVLTARTIFPSAGWEWRAALMCTTKRRLMERRLSYFLPRMRNRWSLVQGGRGESEVPVFYWQACAGHRSSLVRLRPLCQQADITRNETLPLTTHRGRQAFGCCRFCHSPGGKTKIGRKGDVCGRGQVNDECFPKGTVSVVHNRREDAVWQDACKRASGWEHLHRYQQGVRQGGMLASAILERTFMGCARDEGISAAGCEDKTH